MLTGFFQVRNANGPYSLPQEALIINRNTFDYNFNSALNPVLHLGNDWIAFNTGLQFTLRRDSSRRSTRTRTCFASSSTPTAALSAIGCRSMAALYHEAGPFTATSYKQNSNDVGNTLQFTVGRPWGKTALVTGYTRRDLTFSPTPSQYFTTSATPACSINSSKKLTASLLGEYIRACALQRHLMGHGPCPASGRNDPVQLQSRLEGGWPVRLRRRPERFSI